MERMMEKVFKDMPVGNIKPGKLYVRGFNLHIDSNGKPRIQEFGYYPKKLQMVKRDYQKKGSL